MNEGIMNGTSAQRLRDGLGWRAVVGVLVPYTNTIAQPEYEAFRPAGVTNHVARMEQSSRGRTIGDMDSYRRSLARGTDHVKRALDTVLPCEPHMVVLGHSIDTFRGGMAGAEAMKRDLEAHTGGVPVVLPSHGFLAALKALGVGKRLAALTPYWPPGDEQVESFFRDAGFDVCRVLGLKCAGPVAIAATPVSTVIAGLKELAAEKPDVIVQPGTNLPTARLAADASEWLGIPVVSCNTATYWHAMRSFGITDRMDGFGPLLAQH
jgi:maleate isomerase